MQFPRLRDFFLVYKANVLSTEATNARDNAICSRICIRWRWRCFSASSAAPLACTRCYSPKRFALEFRDSENIVTKPLNHFDTRRDICSSVSDLPPLTNGTKDGSRSRIAAGSYPPRWIELERARFRRNETSFWVGLKFWSQYRYQSFIHQLQQMVSRDYQRAYFGNPLFMRRKAQAEAKKKGCDLLTVIHSLYLVFVPNCLFVLFCLFVCLFIESRVFKLQWSRARSQR